MSRLSREQNGHEISASGPKRRYTFLAASEVNLDRSRLSASVRRFCLRYRARRANMTSVGVLMRDRVCVKMLGPGACGLKGKLRSRKKTMAKKRRFRARAAPAGSGRAGGRDAIETRTSRYRLIARGIKIGAKKMTSDLMLRGEVSSLYSTLASQGTQGAEKGRTSRMRFRGLSSFRKSAGDLPRHLEAGVGSGGECG